MGGNIHIFLLRELTTQNIHQEIAVDGDKDGCLSWCYL